MARQRRMEGDRSALNRLHDLLDQLVALRIEYGEGAEGEAALAALGAAKVSEVRTVLDASIDGLKVILGEYEWPPSK